MTQPLSLTHAARLAGVSRGELQERIRQMELHTFEGKIGVDDLLRAYPEIDMDRDPVLERLERIKDHARPKSHEADVRLPEPEVLMARLRDYQTVLIRTKAALNTAEQLLGEVAARLETTTGLGEAELRATAEDLSKRLRQAMTRSEDSPDRKAELFAKDALLRVLYASVRILPSGHEFFVEGRDSLLEAALKSGLHLDYGCSSGNCGACKVRVLAGEVRRIRPHDFVLSAQEQAQGYVLACSNTATTDVLLEATEALTGADLPQQEIRCTLRKVEPVSHDLSMVRIQTPRTQTLRFMAGQRVQLTTEDGHSRELAVASCPCDARNLQFLVRRRSGDSFTEALLAGHSGRMVLVEGPRGNFLLEEEATEPALFIAVDDGFAPVKSLIEHAIAIDNAVQMYLYRIDEVPPGSLLGNLCRSWDDALDNFAYRRLDPGTSPAEVLHEILRDCPKLGECHLYVAGPPEWVESFVEQARARGALGDRLHTDIVELPPTT